MKTRLLLGVLLPVLVAALVVFVVFSPTERPDVLLITIDTLRADHLGVYGYDRETTPSLDALAAEGVVFDAAFTQATLSGPSHATIMTGLHVLTHGVIGNAVTLDDDMLTLAEIFRAAGYETGMFVSHHLVGEEFGFDQGFDTVDLQTVDTHAHAHEGEDEDSPGPPLPGTRERNDRGVFDSISAWLGRDREAPYFAWLHLQHPHDSYEPPPPFDSIFMEPPERAELLRCAEIVDDMSDGDLPYEPHELDYVVALYDGEIAYVDERIGRLLSEVSMKNTVVVVTADHGEMLFDDEARSRLGHGRSRYDATLRVPLIVSSPGLPSAGRRVDAMVSLVDLAPTILDLAGQPVPEALHGQSLASWVRGDEGPSQRESYSATFHTDGRARMSLRTVDRKLVCTKSAEELDCELYDLERDPDELAAVTDPRRAEEKTRLEETLYAWYEETKSEGRLEIGPRSKRARTLLRRAGYLRDEGEP